MLVFGDYSDRVYLEYSRKDAGIPATVFAAKETTHAKINADLGKPDDPATYPFTGRG
jgi:hypothetical protein